MCRLNKRNMPHLSFFHSVILPFSLLPSFTCSLLHSFASLSLHLHLIRTGLTSTVVRLPLATPRSVHHLYRCSYLSLNVLCLFHLSLFPLLLSSPPFFFTFFLIFFYLFQSLSHSLAYCYLFRVCLALASWATCPTSCSAARPSMASARPALAAAWCVDGRERKGGGGDVRKREEEENGVFILPPPKGKVERKEQTHGRDKEERAKRTPVALRWEKAPLLIFPHFIAIPFCSSLSGCGRAAGELVMDEA